MDTLILCTSVAVLGSLLNLNEHGQVTCLRQFDKLSRTAAPVRKIRVVPTRPWLPPPLKFFWGQSLLSPHGRQLNIFVVFRKINHVILLCPIIRNFFHSSLCSLSRNWARPGRCASVPWWAPSHWFTENKHSKNANTNYNNARHFNSSWKRWAAFMLSTTPTQL